MGRLPGALNFLRGVWIISPRRPGALEGREKGRGGWGGGEQSLRVGLVRARTALAAGTLLQAPPRGVSEARVGHTLGGEMPSQA